LQPPTGVFEAGGGKTNGRYYGTTLQHIEFKIIRDAGGATPARAAYNQLREQGGIYSTLPAVTRADQIPENLDKWEADNPDKRELGRDNGQFFGFTNVGRGALNKFINFVFIPAVRDAAMDALDSRGAVIARLMELVVRSAVQQRKEIRAFQFKVSEEYRILTDPEKLTELGGLSDDLTGTIKLFYHEAAVALRWKPAEEFSLPLPTADVFLDDDGFEGPVDRKQRSSGRGAAWGGGMSKETIVRAITDRSVVEFKYSGEVRKAEPHLLGIINQE
jgi:putative ATP-dependent endonuclease of OLD family